MTTQLYASLFIGFIGLLVLGAAGFFLKGWLDQRKYTQTKLPSLDGDPVAVEEKDEEGSAFSLNGLERKSYDEVIKDSPDLAYEPNADAFLEPALVVPSVPDSPLPALPPPPPRPEVVLEDIPAPDNHTPASHASAERDFLDEVLEQEGEQAGPSPVVIQSRSIGFDDVPRFNEIAEEDRPYVGRRMK